MTTGEILVLGQTRAAVDEYVRAIGGEGSIGIHRLTLTQFAAELAATRLAERGLAPAPRLGLEAIAARVIHRLHADGKLAYFGRVAKYPGFPGALAATLNDLRLAGVRPAPGDLALLYDEYCRELDRRGVADLAEIFALAGDALEEWSPIPVRTLELHLPSVAHRQFLERIPNVERIHPPAAGEGALGHLCRHLFSTERPPQTTYDATLDCFSSPGEGLEAVEIARRIRLLEDTPFDRVAILLRSPERYQFLVEEALRRAGIPAYFSRGSSRPDPAGRAFLALLHCASEKLSATRFAEYLSLGQVPDKPARPEWVPPADDTYFAADGAVTAREPEVDAPAVATPIAWERLLVDAAVIGGRDRWHRRLRGLEEEYRLTGRPLEKLQNLERFALPLIDLLDALPDAAGWSLWLDHLRGLAAASLRYPDSVLATLAELDPLAGIGPVAIDEVIQVLSERLRFLRREPPHRRYGRVFVGSIDEARGRSFDIVFLPGLAEGLFPSRTFEDPLLLDEARAALSPGLPRRKDKSDDERDLLRVAVQSAHRRFVFSYPSMDVAQGRPRVPSLFALELARAVEGRVPKLEEFERRLSLNAESRLVWPAPRDPEHAIDNAEYDLAWHLEHAREKGSSRYLIEASKPLYRSLQARYRRWEKRWTFSDGLVGLDPGARTVLHVGRRTAAWPYSPTALQSYAACPYKFYLYGVYGLREREQAAALEQMDPLTRGALFHAVQFDFFSRWRANPVRELQPALDLLDAAIATVTAEYEEKLAPAIRRVWESEINDLSIDLRAWMRLWFASLDEWEPVHFELAFGLSGDDKAHHDPSSTAEPVMLAGGALVRGSIDLVERHRTRGTLRVVDHKTGKPPEQAPVCIGGGATLQPALYGLAVEELLQGNTEAGRLFYCTQRGGFTPIDITLNNATRMRFEHTMAAIDSAIESGFLPAAPAKDACDSCDYRAVCGPYEQQRVRHKDADSLEPLLNIRRMP